MKGIHKFDLITSVSLTAITLAVLGFFYYSISIYTPDTFSDEKLREKALNETTENSFLLPVPIERVVINLPTSNSRLRFLELEMSIETIKEEHQEKVKNLKPIIIDAAINIAGSMSPEELNSLSGKLLLEERLKRKIRQKTKQSIISRIFYSRFVIQ